MLLLRLLKIQSNILHASIKRSALQFSRVFFYATNKIFIFRKFTNYSYAILGSCDGNISGDSVEFTFSFVNTTNITQILNYVTSVLGSNKYMVVKDIA